MFFETTNTIMPTTTQLINPPIIIISIIFEKLRLEKSKKSVLAEPAKSAIVAVKTIQINATIIRIIICENTDLFFKTIPPFCYFNLFQIKSQ